MEKYLVCDVAKITGLSEHTIRFYDKKNIIPDIIRDKNNKRIFTQNALNWVYLINALRKSSLPIKEIKQYISFYQQGDKTLKQRYDIIVKQEKKLKHTITELQKQLKKITEKRYKYEKSLEDNIFISDPNQWKDC